MKKSYVMIVMLVVVMFLSPVIVSAGEISSQKVTDSEEASFSIVAASTPQALDIQCGGNAAEALVSGVVVFFVVLIVASAVLSGA